MSNNGRPDDGQSIDLEAWAEQSCCAAEDACITCADNAIPACVLSVDDATGQAVVTIGDHTEAIDISLVDGVTPGALLLIHAGIAIGCLKEVRYE
ncbi:MAG TPA: HypC/HybG/HupF family hydrogenase formation chaperone [Ktedonosporobacter sp.]|jgi:hydrogenase maturation factor|nr:HypC/HybG/HupF family hydrogenase formation chaperone [Ktedonosporobacter sp.]